MKSNWNGQFDFAPADALYIGLKPFSCSIRLRSDFADRPERWRTIIHEAFHAISAGYNGIAYDHSIGFEEAVVEQLQRMFRQRLLRMLNVIVDESVFLPGDANHPFNLYVDKMREIQRLLSREEEPFYLELIAVPLKDRYAHLLNKAIAAGNRNAIAVLSAARTVLEGKRR